MCHKEAIWNALDEGSNERPRNFHIIHMECYHEKTIGRNILLLELI